MSERFTYNGFTITIEPDCDGSDNGPRDWDNVGTMVCWHNRYTLGDIQPACSPDKYMLELMQLREYRLHVYWVPDDIKLEHVKRYINKHFIVLPLYLYDHGGLSMCTSPFGCPWDSGQVGFIYVERTSREYSDPIAGLTAEVDIYDQWLRGDVYCYTVEDSAGEILDSCCGFYGYDDCRQEAIEACANCLA